MQAKIERERKSILTRGKKRYAKREIHEEGKKGRGRDPHDSVLRRKREQ